MGRHAALALLFLTLGCTAQSAATPAGSPNAIRATPAPSLRPLPPPSQDAAYPPATLADVVALADSGVDRKFIGAEGQPLTYCSRAWMRIYEPDGLTPRQEAADLLRVAIARHVLTKSCGASSSAPRTPRTATAITPTTGTWKSRGVLRASRRRGRWR